MKERNLSRIMNEYKSKHFFPFSPSQLETKIYSIQFRLMKGFQYANGGIDVNEACVVKDEARKEKKNYLEHFFKQCAFNSVSSTFTSRYELRFRWKIFAIYNMHIKLAVCLSQSDKCFKYLEWKTFSTSLGKKKVFFLFFFSLGLGKS